MDINTPGAGSAINSIVTKEFQKGIDEATVISGPMTETVSSTAAYNIYSWMSHIAGFKEWFEGQPRVMRNFKSNQYTVKNRRFDLSLKISVDAVDDDQLDQYKPEAKNIGYQGTILDDELSFDLLNGGFDATTTYDDLYWFSASHKAGLSTINNLASGALTTSTLQTAMTTMRNWTVQPDKESTARPLNPSPKWLLVVPPALEWTAEGILKTKLITTGTAFGDNIMHERAELMVASRLTSSTTAWFLLNIGEGIKPIFIQNRSPVQLIQKTPLNDNEAFMYDELVWAGKRRLAALPTLPWLACGSTGL